MLHVQVCHNVQLVLAVIPCSIMPALLVTYKIAKLARQQTLAQLVTQALPCSTINVSAAMCSIARPAKQPISARLASTLSSLSVAVLLARAPTTATALLAINAFAPRKPLPTMVTATLAMFNSALSVKLIMFARPVLLHLCQTLVALLAYVLVDLCNQEIHVYALLGKSKAEASASHVLCLIVPHVQALQHVRRVLLLGHPPLMALLVCVSREELCQAAVAHVQPTTSSTTMYVIFAISNIVRPARPIVCVTLA